MTIGKYVKFERKNRGLTIKDLSDLTGLSRAYISQIENGERHGFSAIKKIIEALGLTMEDCKAAGVDWWGDDEKPTDTTVFVAGAPGNGKTEYLKTILEYFEKDPEFVIKLAKALRAIEGGDEK